MTDTVRIEGDLASIRFDRYDLDAYRLFLKTKALPEQEVTFDWETDTYEITTPARFAPLLGVAVDRQEGARLPLPAHLFDYQRWAVELALEARRFALFLDTGLGKTAVYLEWARQVQAITGGRVLILAPLAVIPQVIAEAARFYPPSHVYPDGAVCETFVITHLKSRDELIRWCRTGEEADHWTHQPTVFAIANYEKFIPGQISELRHLAGLVADESSVLKTGGGVIKWNLIKSARGIAYKLSCTATPAPNEPMEYASQAAFLEKLRHENDILWTWFKRNKYGEWFIPGHAKPHFYRFLASWSLYMRDPAAFGFADILSSLPPPEVREERLPLTDEQRVLMTEVLVTHKVGMFADNLPMRPRQKLMQLARGFLYEGTGTAKRIRAVDSAKARRVAEIIDFEVAAGHRVLVWTTFDEEAEVIADLLRSPLHDSGDVAVLAGKSTDEERLAILGRFRAGDVQVLISKAALLGYGLNLQFVTSMVFSGFDDSFERAYQAVRRAYRYGQTLPVRVWWPYVPELEGLVFGNIRTKEARFLEEVAAQEGHYRNALADQLAEAVAA